MSRPVEFVDLKATCVTLERELLEKAKAEGLNLSDELRMTLRKRLGNGGQKKQEDKARKFRGLPEHVVNEVKQLRIKGRPGTLRRTLEYINSFYGRDLTVADVDELLPVF